MARIIVLPLIAAALATAGCVPMAAVPRNPFPTAEYASVPKNTVVGTAEVKGQAFLKTRGGDVKRGAGNEVRLNPVTSYSNQWFQVAVVQGLPIGPVDPRILEYVRTTIADADGRFEFRGVPAGEYYATCHVVWEVPSQFGLEQTGGLVVKRVAVRDGDRLDVILTR